MKNRFLSFEDARIKIRGLGIKSWREWFGFCRSGRKQNDIPSNPDKVYKSRGWCGWIDWLKSSNKKHNKTYSINEDYFKKWSHNMAYILGLWFSDGCISGTHFNITLHKNDSVLLNNILEEMKSEHKLYYCKNCAKIDISSKKIVDSIIRLGGVPRKSLTVKFPHVPNKYLSDFVRGLWDGDGCIFFNKRSKRYKSNICSGSRDFIYVMLRILRKNIRGFKGNIYKRIFKKGCDILGNKLGKDSILYVLEVEINDTIRLNKFLYANADKYLKMKRKFEKFTKVGNIRIAYKDRRYLSYKKAKKIVNKFYFKSRKEWFKYCRNNGGNEAIPFAPHLFYKNIWEGWQKFLGYSHHFVSLGDAKKIIRSTGVKNRTEWIEYRKRFKEKRIPFHPDKVYKNEGWKGWKDYLGIE